VRIQGVGDLVLLLLLVQLRLHWRGRGVVWKSRIFGEFSAKCEVNGAQLDLVLPGLLQFGVEHVTLSSIYLV
jgi:hypothetical protein